MKPITLFLYLAAGTFLASCASSQVAHTEWDDVYFNSTDRQKARYASSSAKPSSDEDGSYPNNIQNNGSINNYPGNYTESNTANPNATSADYVNPNYQASGSSYEATDASPASSSPATSGGATYVTNNYYDTDNYYRSSNFRNFGFSPFNSFGYGGWGGGWGSGWNVGFGYNSRFGWYGPSIGYSMGWGWPGYGFNTCGWNTGWGFNPWYGGGFYDPFWGPTWRYNSWAYNPMGFGNPYWSPYYNPYYGPYFGNTGGGGGGERPVPIQTNRPAANMSGNLNPNVVSTPGSSPVPNTAGRRNQGAQTTIPGGQPTSPDNTNPTRQNNPDPNAGLFRPGTNQTPDRYSSQTRPEDYTPQSTPNPGRRGSDESNSIFRPSPSTPTQRSGDQPTFVMPERTERRSGNDNPINAVPPAAERQSRSDIFRNDNNEGRRSSGNRWGSDNGSRSNQNFFRNDQSSGSRGSDNFFRGGNSGGGGNRGSGTSAPSGGRRRGM